jgi:spore germination protein YaaH
VPALRVGYETRVAHYTRTRVRNRVILVAMAVLALLGVATVLTNSRRSGRLDVTGFQLAGDSRAFIDRDRAPLTTVAVDGVQLRPDGAAIARIDPNALDQLRRAHADGLRAELVLNNWNSGDFSALSAARLLASPDHIARVAGQLAAVIAGGHWDGLCVDIENMQAADGPGLVRLLHRLRALLGSRRSISVTISNETSPAAYVAAGYQLAAIGRTVGRVILMAYDEHGPWEPTPGPIGALGWQRRGLEVLLGAVPASAVELGVAGYGYRWPRSGRASEVSDAMARSLSAGAARFDAVSGEWTARLADGSVLWWSDARSYPLRAQLARSMHLHGLAVWSLGLSDPLR